MMPNSRLIDAALRTTPVDLKSTRGRARPIPADLLKDASRRLGVVALLGAALWFVGTVADHIASRIQGNGWKPLDITDYVGGIAVPVSIGLFFYTRYSKRDPAFILDMGLAYMIATALGLGLMVHLAPPPPHPRSLDPEISWIGAMVVIFAATLPTNPNKTLIAGLIAVSMSPVGMLIARAQGTWKFDGVANALVMHYPDYLLVGVAVVISKVVATLGQQVAKAREMGSYRLGDLLGYGGMGEVYKATHSMLARPAAIKLIRSDTVGAGDAAAAQLAIKRFRREAEVAASLRSPHTVELYDFGVTDGQTLYFVMELLDGMNLEALVRQTGPVPADRAIYILRQVCDSLQEAHTRGLVHRDIKPANIHVGLVGLQHDFVKVLDFGLVKSVEAKPSEHSMATAAGLTPGTPAYMAPEMVLGEQVDGRADIYAVGCVAYYMLTGQVVFEAENSVQMLARHMMAAPVPPSERAKISLPRELERLVLACLEKKPDRRPQTAAELSSALAAVEVAPWNEARAVEWWQGHRTAERP
jgi:tRNA A-37 threonylcarbamoyl transferase component Bud32